MTNRLDHAKMQAFWHGACHLVKPEPTGLVGSFFWIGCIGKLRDERFHTDQWIDPAKHLSYQMPEIPFEISNMDFRKTAMDYLCFKMEIDTREFGERLLKATLYSSEINQDEKGVNIRLRKETDDEN